MSNAPVREVVGGVDTHKDAHVAAVIDTLGRLLGTEAFPTTALGYANLLRWVQSLGAVRRIGVEGTSSYGAGLTRYLRRSGIDLVEVSRPSRQFRRQRGKSDLVDAEAAARAALVQETARVPKAQDGTVELLRIIRVQRRRPSTVALERVTNEVLRGLAQRWTRLHQEIRTLVKQIDELVRACAPDLLARLGVGPEVASGLLVAAGGNPERLRNERSFAALCGVAPVDASSGRQQRHRLNRGGNRDANRALWVIAFVRLRIDPATKAYMTRRLAQGRSKLEVLRCLKRYIAREVFKLLQPLCAPPADTFVAA